MQLSPSPDLSSVRRIGLVVLLVWLVECAILVAQGGAHLQHNLGDPDDAMRLVLVRSLLSGQGWFDQLVTRLDPPHGVYLHWSRLLDGALASAIAGARLIFSPGQAELVVRAVWPLAWIFPVLLSALLVARNLGARSAVLIAAIMLAIDAQPYRQFIPGRIDHHNIQVTLAMAAFAAAMLGSLGPRAAAAAGVFSGLGLAIGLEALPFHALIGASVVLRFLKDRRETRTLAGYGLALAASTTLFFLVQTPPWRWGLSVCDALGVNLVTLTVVAGLGFAAVAALAPKLSRGMTFAAIGLVACAALASYLLLDSRCIHGPFADVAPRARVLWLSHVQELESWPATFAQGREFAVHALTMIVMAGVSAIYLWWRRRQGVPEILALVAFAVAAAIALQAQRAEDYVFWMGLPILAAALSVLAEKLLNDRMLPTVAMATALTPIFVAAVIGSPFERGEQVGQTQSIARARCNDPDLYRRLSQLPKGTVLADLNLGSYILASTQDSVVVAPYHRMSNTILAAFDALNAPPDQTEPRVRALGANYIVDCSFRATGPTSLIARLRSGRQPSWLIRLSAPREPLQIWQVKS